MKYSTKKKKNVLWFFQSNQSFLIDEYSINKRNCTLKAVIKIIKFSNSFYLEKNKLNTSVGHVHNANRIVISELGHFSWGGGQSDTKWHFHYFLFQFQYHDLFVCAFHLFPYLLFECRHHSDSYFQANALPSVISRLISNELRIQ